MKIRSLEPEYIDLGQEYYTKDEYYGCLYQLGRIHKYLGANNFVLKIFQNLPYKIDSILDVGCGGGYFAYQLAKTFLNAKVLGIDINSMAIDYAQLYKLTNLKFELRQLPELNEPEKSFDIVTSTLVMHHLTNEQIIDFLKRAKKVARKNIIINDLHRNSISYYFAKIIIPIFFANRLVKNDSLLSIKKSFTYDDWIYYLNKAGFESKNYKIMWHWNFRWIVQVNINE